MHDCNIAKTVEQFKDNVFKVVQSLCHTFKQAYVAVCHFPYLDKTMLEQYYVTIIQLQGGGEARIISKIEKAKDRIRSKPKDYTYTEAKSLLSQMGFNEVTKGKTSGSRVKYYRKRDNKIILLHKPHPGDVMKPGTVKDLLEFLMGLGEL